VVPPAAKTVQHLFNASLRLRLTREHLELEKIWVELLVDDFSSDLQCILAELSVFLLTARKLQELKQPIVPTQN
jgi:hypothetical protein